MTNNTLPTVMIFLILASFGVLGAISFEMATAAEDSAEAVARMAADDNLARAVPGWVDNNFRWYGEGLIGQSDLLNSLSYMLDNGLMHLSDKAAQEAKQLKDENKMLRSGIGTFIADGKIHEEDFESMTGINVAPADGVAIPNLLEARKSANESAQDPDGSDRVKVQFHWDKETEQEALSHLRKAYDLNPNLQTKVVQLDDKHKKWIDVLSIDWGASSTSGDPDRPIVIGRVYNTDGISGESVSVDSRTIVFTGLEFSSQTVDDIIAKGGTESNWEDGITSFSAHGLRESVNSELEGIVVLCNNVIDKKTQSIDAELKILEQWLKIISEKQQSESYDASGRLTSDTTTESGVQYRESDLEFISRNLESIDKQIKSLDTGIDVLEEKLSSIGDDAQLANIDLQNKLQQQQQTLQTMSNVSKALHDTAMSIIRKMG